MEHPLISVIVPVYRVEKELDACIDSIRAQTYTNLEVILVNDGSPDRCGEICESHRAFDPRIKVIHKANGGLSDARNAGLNVASGEFIVFIDSDDIVHPEYVETLLRNIEDADLIFCNFTTFQEDVSIHRSKKIDSTECRRIDAMDMLKQLNSYEYPAGIVAWNKLYRKHLWEKIRYPVGKIHEDEFVIHTLLHIAKSVKHINAPLYFYRQRKNSIMGSESNSKKSLLHKMEAYFLRGEYYRSQGMNIQAFEMNSEVLYRCLLPSISKDNEVWKEMDIKTILFKNKLTVKAKALLCIKKLCYPLYVLIVNILRKI